MTSAILRVVLCTMVLRDAVLGHVLVKREEVTAVKPVSFDDLRSCWSDDDASCNDAVAGLLGRAGTVRLNDFAVLEETDPSQVAPEPADASDMAEGRGVAEQAAKTIAKLLRARALRLNLWDLAELGVRIAPDQPESIEITLDATENGEDGQPRGHRRMTRVIVPLILGFKLTGALILAISVVKLFLVKAFVVSKLALLAAIYMMVRKLMATVGVQHHPYLYSQHKLPAYSIEGYPAASDYSYSYGTPYHAAAGYYAAAPGHYSEYGPYAAVTDGGVGAAGVAGAIAGDDLHGHFSTNSLSVQPARNITKISRTDGMKHAVYGLVKSSAHRIPVNTYRKLVTTGRKMAP